MKSTSAVTYLVCLHARHISIRRVGGFIKRATNGLFSDAGRGLATTTFLGLRGLFWTISAEGVVPECFCQCSTKTLRGESGYPCERSIHPQFHGQRPEARRRHSQLAWDRMVTVSGNFRAVVALASTNKLAGKAKAGYEEMVKLLLSRMTSPSGSGTC